MNMKRADANERDGMQTSCLRECLCGFISGNNRNETRHTRPCFASGRRGRRTLKEGAVLFLLSNSESSGLAGAALARTRRGDLKNPSPRGAVLALQRHRQLFRSVGLTALAVAGWIDQTGFVNGARLAQAAALGQTLDGLRVDAAAVQRRLVDDVADRVLQRHRLRHAVHCAPTNEPSKEHERQCE